MAKKQFADPRLNRLIRVQNALSSYEGVSKQEGEDRNDDLLERLDVLEAENQKIRSRFIRKFWFDIAVCFFKITYDNLVDFVNEIIKT